MKSIYTDQFQQHNRVSCSDWLRKYLGIDVYLQILPNTKDLVLRSHGTVPLGVRHCCCQNLIVHNGHTKCPSQLLSEGRPGIETRKHRVGIHCAQHESDLWLETMIRNTLTLSNDHIKSHEHEIVRHCCVLWSVDEQMSRIYEVLQRTVMRQAIAQVLQENLRIRS